VDVFLSNVAMKKHQQTSSSCLLILEVTDKFPAILEKTFTRKL